MKLYPIGKNFGVNYLKQSYFFVGIDTHKIKWITIKYSFIEENGMKLLDDYLRGEISKYSIFLISLF